MANGASVLVVGVGSADGVGAAVGRRFGREGFRIVLAGRNAAKLDGAADSVRATGAEVEVVVGDAAVEADAVRFAEAGAAHGQLAVAVHNAGSNRPDGFLDTSVEIFERFWREHTLGGFLTGREAVRRMLPQGAGTVIFTGASASLRGKARFPAFAAAKFGLRAVSQSLAREFGAQGIHVAHVVIDGGIDGERLNTMVPGLKADRGPDGLLSIEAIAETYWQIHRQHRSAWTQEVDLRPWVENY